MKTILCLFTAAVLFCMAGPAVAQTGPSPTLAVDVLTTHTFVVVQNPLSVTTKKTAQIYVRSGGNIEASAWRWIGAAWVRVIPNPAEFADIGSDSVIIGLEDTTLTITGQFDALTLKAITVTSPCLINVYR